MSTSNGEILIAPSEGTICTRSKGTIGTRSKGAVTTRSKRPTGTWSWSIPWAH